MSVSYLEMGDGLRMAYRWDEAPDAAGSAPRPVLVLSNSIGTSLAMWDALVPVLVPHFRVLRYDMRGHGASSVPPGAYSMDRLGRDVLALMDAQHIERAHFMGLSLGGFVGQWLGVHAPERLDRLVLCNTSSWLGLAAQWDASIHKVLAEPDRAAIAEQFLRNWFPQALLAENGPAVQLCRSMLMGTAPQGLAGAYAAVRDVDLRRTIALIDRPTLVIAGQWDRVTAAEHSEQMARTIPGAELLVLPAVHMSHMECPQEFTAAVLGFLHH